MMKICAVCITILIHFVHFCTSEFVKLKIPYKPIREIQLGHLSKYIPASPGLSPRQRPPASYPEKVDVVSINGVFLSTRGPPAMPSTSFRQIDDPVIHQSLKSITPTPRQSPTTTATKLQTRRTARTTEMAPKQTSTLGTKQCPESSPNGTWGEWYVTQECSSECGACGRQTRIRNCESFDLRSGAGCPCRGPYKAMESCNIQVCGYPKPSCCPPFNLEFKNDQFICGPHETSIYDKHFSNLKISKPS